MTGEDKKAQEAAEKLTAFVVGEMRAGKSQAAIVQGLVAKGVDAAEAEKRIGELHEQVAAQARREQFTPASLLPAALGGLLAAVVGGVIWGTIVIFTNYEIGYVAWGVGALAGFGVVRLAGGRKGLPLQLVAVAASVLGLLIGKYIIFAHFVRASLVEGGEAVTLMQILLSPRGPVVFAETLPKMVSGFDALWVVLALLTAWRIPKGLGIRAQ